MLYNPLMNFIIHRVVILRRLLNGYLILPLICQIWILHLVAAEMWPMLLCQMDMEVSFFTPLRILFVCFYRHHNWIVLCWISISNLQIHPQILLKTFTTKIIFIFWCISWIQFLYFCYLFRISTHRISEPHWYIYTLWALCCSYLQRW